MPIYEYIATEGGCANCREGFELIQRLSDEPLTQCPTCKTTIRRKLTAAKIASKESEILDAKNVGEKGFARYRNVGNGVYEKEAGEGPNKIRRPKDG